MGGEVHYVELLVGSTVVRIKHMFTLCNILYKTLWLHKNGGLRSFIRNLEENWKGSSSEKEKILKVSF